MTPAARISAVIELLEIIEKEFQTPADAIANRFFRNRRYIGGGDRRLVSAQLWELMRHHRRLKWWLKRIACPISPRMMVAAFEILTGKNVKQVQELFSGERYAPLSLSSNEKLFLEDLVGKSFNDPQMPKAVQFEVPDWVYPKMVHHFGEDVEKELTALLQPASLDLRVNLLKTDIQEAQKLLKKENILAEPMLLSPWGLRVSGRQNVTTTKVFQEGLVEIQDEGSQLIALMTGVKPHMRVLDFCAGAGGKTLAMAMMMENKGHIIATDVFSVRLTAAERRFRRAGVFNVQTHQFTEGAKWVKRREKSFDRVLVDAPCSGTGTWRRNPDARLKFRERDLIELVTKQSMILEKAARLVKPGGRLIYATCSILEDENELQIQNFVEKYPEFSPVLPEEDTMLPEIFRKHSYFQLSPARYNTDGFFCAILERKPSENQE